MKLALFDTEFGMMARDAVVRERHVAAGVAAHDDMNAAQVEHLAAILPLDDGDIGHVPARLEV